MLRDVIAAIRVAGRPMCLTDLSHDLGIEQSALEGMLEMLVARGRLRAIVFDDVGCSACPIKGGCFIMSDGVAKAYALLPDAAAPEASLPSFR
jgi:hypothetical protein